MGNTVGSMSASFCSFFSNEDDAYILGFWCAEKYYWRSSIGVSNTDPDLIERFAQFLRKHFLLDRLRLRIYYPIKGSYSIDRKILSYVKRLSYRPYKKAKKIGYHLYVNSRPLLREFIAARNNINKLRNSKVIQAYFAGRFDGDGSIDKNLRNDCRIGYGEKRNEVAIDQTLLKRIGIHKTTIYYYRTSPGFYLYISRYDSNKFLQKIHPYSLKLQKLALVPRRDLTLTNRAKRELNDG